MGKGKVTGDVAMMEVPHSSSDGGVLTRAKTLALQRRVKDSTNLDSCYMELRSRRLERLNPLQISRKNRNKSSHGCYSLGADKVNDFDYDVAELGRSTRESTPCNLIMSVNTISSPRSTRKQKFMSPANQSIRNIPGASVASVPEVDELFVREQQMLQGVFLEKYNFDINNELPLPGRYEWVKIGP